MHKTVLVNDIRGGGCGSGNSEAKLGEVRYDSSDVEDSTVQYVYGKGMSSIVHELADDGTDTVHRFRHEDQAGSLVGVTDENGLRTDEYFYQDFGTPVHRKIAFDGNNDRISSVQADTPSTGITRVNFTGVTLTADEFNGKQARVIGSLHIGNVDDTGTTYIDINDPHDDLYTTLNAGADFVIFDFDSPEVDINASGVWDDVNYDEIADHTNFIDDDATFTSSINPGDHIQPDITFFDVWVSDYTIQSDTRITLEGDQTLLATAGISYEVRPSIWSYASGESTYTNDNASFEDYMEGWLFTPDVTEPCYLQITEVVSSTVIKVRGDARGLSDPDDPWRVHAPPGVDPATGGQYVDMTDAGSKYLNNNMRYLSPQAGFEVSSTIYGRQTGVLLSGTYYIGATYDPNNGSYFQANKKQVGKLTKNLPSPSTPSINPPEPGPPPPKPEPGKFGKKCCCAKHLTIYPFSADKPSTLHGGKSFKDYWGKQLDDTIAAARARGAQVTAALIEKFRKQSWGDPKKLGKEKLKNAAGDPFMMFKFQSVGQVEWIDWDGANEPDCTFDQELKRTNPDGTVVAKRSDFAVAKQDPNVDAGSIGANGNHGVRVRSGDKYSWVDATQTGIGNGTPLGLYKREFTMTLSSASGCPCSRSSIVRKRTLNIDTSKTPVSVTWGR